MTDDSDPARDLRNLKAKEQRGSRPRCLLLTHGADVDVAARLNTLLAPAARIDPTRHIWAPGGFSAPDEFELDKAADFLSQETRRALRAWWLAVSSNMSRLPTWDLLATAEIDGRDGLVLVEAKAHHAELSTSGKPQGAPANDARIAACIAEACAGLNEVCGGWFITAQSHYQLANRFAWAWKLAHMGVPVALVYLGFTGAAEMADRGRPIVDDADWARMLAAYGAGIVPEGVWNTPLDIAGTSLVALQRTMRIDLPVAEADADS